jgi:hypothetical protein
MMRRFLSGVLAAGSTMGMVGLVMFIDNTLVRHYAAHRLANDPNDVTAEALLLGF